MTSSSCVAAPLLRPSPQSLWSPSAVFLRMWSAPGMGTWSVYSGMYRKSADLSVVTVFAAYESVVSFHRQCLCAGLTFEGLGEEIAFEFQLVRCAFFLARCEACDMGELQSPATRVWSYGESGLGPSLGVAGFICQVLANSPHERWHKENQSPLPRFFPGAPEGFCFVLRMA